MKKIILIISLFGIFSLINAQEYVESKTSIPSNNANNAIGEKNAIWRNNQIAPPIENNFPNSQNWWSIFQTQFNDTRYDAQLAFGLNREDLWLRYNFNGNWKNWKKIILSDYNGNVGIGTTTTSNGILTVNGDSYSTMRLENDTPNREASIRFRSKSNSGGTLHSDISLYATGNNQGYLGFKVPHNNTVNNGYDMIINHSGNVGIGTTNPESWRLAVNGKIRAKEIKVETGWSDFVFFDDYQLPTLQEVENHIKENGHLKDIPSAKEVEENGIFLGQMDSKLLQKIEELTLYTIAQEKKMNIQNAKIEKLEKENQELKSLSERLAKIEKLLESQK
ncbi:hypothetical protein [uncultured Aquimarina sp.]|uniref:hypothetical protein n=1 Tax=uncultured Aquimarina sp. TaxID=575652 RepID=UPI00261BEA11|nr:hypothetical protein [uncultured Aquimarina sp.]